MRSPDRTSSAPPAACLATGRQAKAWPSLPTSLKSAPWNCRAVSSLDMLTGKDSPLLSAEGVASVVALETRSVAGSDVPLHSSTRSRNFRLHETEHGNGIARNGVSRCGVPTAQPQDLLGPAALLESTVIRDTDGPRRVSGRVECDGSASGRALDVSHVRHDSCNVAHGSIGVAEAVQRADVRPAPERLEP